MNDIPRMITVGKIKGLNKTTKFLTIQVLTDNESRFRSGSNIWCLGNVYTIVGSKNKKANQISVRLSPDNPYMPMGSEITVPYETVESLEEGTFYHEDLVGIKELQEDQWLGELTDIIQTGSNDVYVITKGTSEKLIPALRSVVKDVDIDNKNMSVVLPKGL